MKDASFSILKVLIEHRNGQAMREADIHSTPRVHRHNLGAMGFGRKITSSEAGHELKETQASYRDHFGCKKAHLSHENAFSWRIYDEISI